MPEEGTALERAHDRWGASSGTNDDTIIAYWSAFQAASGSKPKSIEDRVTNLRAILRRTGKTLLTMTRQDLIADLGRPGIKPSTRSHMKSLMHTVFTWLQEEEFRLDNPAVRLPKVRVPASEPDPVTTDDIKRLLNSGIYARTRMYVLLYAYQGFRASEIAAVSETSVDWHRRRILSVE